MRINIIGVPIDLGANRRGVDMGPSAIRYAMLREELVADGHEVEDLGNIPVPERESLISEGGQVNFFPHILQVNEHLAQVVRDVMGAGSFPLVLGGDHSLAIGTMAGLASQAKPFGVLWFDAHGDFNTPDTSHSGNVHGMPLAISVGRGAAPLVCCGGPGPKVREDKVTLIGVRDLDPEEKRLLRESAVTVYTMEDIDELGIREVVKQALAKSGRDVAGIYVSLDMDVLDPMQVPGVGTPVRGGLTYREAHLAMEMVARSNQLLALDVVEVNPIIDHRNQTAELAVELIASAMGRRIL